MEELSCQVLLSSYPNISEVDHLRSTCIANCVFNNFLSCTAIVLNIVTIHAIKRTSSLPKTLKTLLLSLAVSDVGVGLLVQPFYISLLIKWLQHTTPGCVTYRAFGVITSLFSIASFYGNVALSVDRFLAVHLHLRYQELVTHKLVVAVVICVWVLSAFLSFMVLWVPAGVRSLVVFFSGVACVIVTTIIYGNIYATVRLHKTQIQALQVQPQQQVEQAGEMANFASLIKSAVGTFYVYLVFLICYLPFFIYLAGIRIGGPSIAFERFYLISLTFVFLNSSLNPVIYCWKIRHIRHAIVNILRSVSWHRNWP